MARHIDTLIVHCSATPPEMDIGAEEIRRWHTDPPPHGRGWNDIGYHYVIRRDGSRETGRPLDRMGAHAAGHNEHSVGICLVGGTDADDRSRAEANFTLAQYQALADLVAELRRDLPITSVLGHRDLPGVAKSCPCFDARALLGVA